MINEKIWEKSISLIWFNAAEVKETTLAKFKVSPYYWIVIYKNKISGEEVYGIGETLEEAEEEVNRIFLKGGI